MIEPLSDVELAELERVYGEATPPPWEYWVGNPWHASAPNHRLRKDGDNPPEVFTTGNSNSGFFYRDGVQRQAKADTAAIAALHNAFPRLMATIRRFTVGIPIESRTIDSLHPCPHCGTCLSTVETHCRKCGTKILWKVGGAS